MSTTIEQLKTRERAEAWLADAREREIRADHVGALGAVTLALREIGVPWDDASGAELLRERLVEIRGTCLRRLAGTLPEGSTR